MPSNICHYDYVLMFILLLLCSVQIFGQIVFWCIGNIAFDTFMPIKPI